jgi:hypothetical protein
VPTTVNFSTYWPLRTLITMPKSVSSRPFSTWNIDQTGLYTFSTTNFRFPNVVMISFPSLYFYSQSANWPIKLKFYVDHLFVRTSGPYCINIFHPHSLLFCFDQRNHYREHTAKSGFPSLIRNNTMPSKSIYLFYLGS